MVGFQAGVAFQMRQHAWNEYREADSLCDQRSQVCGGEESLGHWVIAVRALNRAVQVGVGGMTERLGRRIELAHRLPAGRVDRFLVPSDARVKVVRSTRKPPTTRLPARRRTLGTIPRRRAAVVQTELLLGEVAEPWGPPRP